MNDKGLGDMAQEIHVHEAMLKNKAVREAEDLKYALRETQSGQWELYDRSGKALKIHFIINGAKGEWVMSDYLVVPGAQEPDRYALVRSTLAELLVVVRNERRTLQGQRAEIDTEAFPSSNQN